ncbi:MAG: hypothetical protein F6K10_23035 [Moorea sp. SIO2B7]|nr:hypothetical protein [Moorena sp. SIO2B7]
MKDYFLNEESLKFLKIMSTVLIISAIGIELWMLIASFSQQRIPDFLNLIIKIAGVALVCHVLEGVLGAFYAAPRGKNSLKYGVYTFFTGIFGLLELFD